MQQRGCYLPALSHSVFVSFSPTTRGRNSQKCIATTRLQRVARIIDEAAVRAGFAYSEAKQCFWIAEMCAWIFHRTPNVLTLSAPDCRGARAPLLPSLVSQRLNYRRGVSRAPSRAAGSRLFSRPFCVEKITLRAEKIGPCIFQRPTRITSYLHFRFARFHEQCMGSVFFLLCVYHARDIVNTVREYRFNRKLWHADSCLITGKWVSAAAVRDNPVTRNNNVAAAREELICPESYWWLDR